jgi:upstream activation factor subunit UAF30
VTGRSTRGGGATTKRKPVVKQQRKKKSKARVGSDDDSEAEGGEKKEVKRTGGFHVRAPDIHTYLLSECQLTIANKIRNPWRSRLNSRPSSTKPSSRARKP